jgi:hypothetical protein
MCENSRKRVGCGGTPAREWNRHLDDHGLEYTIGETRGTVLKRMTELEGQERVRGGESVLASKLSPPRNGNHRSR